MNIRCENCGQPALASDSTCWQCGEPLPGREQQSSVKVQAKERWGPATSPTTLVIYLASTLIVIVAALLVMRSIGRQPLVQLRLGTRPPPGWQVVTQHDKLFALDLPGNWRWLDRADPEQASEIEALMQRNDLYRSGLEPWSSGVVDMSVLFLAFDPQNHSDVAAAFIVIGRSKTLSRLSYDGAQQYLESGEYPILDVAMVDDFDKSHLGVLVDIPGLSGETDTLRCKQQYVHRQEGAIVVAGCAPASQFGANETLFTYSLAGFQWFAP